MIDCLIFSTKIKVYTVSELLQAPIEKNLIKTFENMDPLLKESIKTKFKIEDFTIENCNLILSDLSMKTYIYYHYGI